MFWTVDEKFCEWVSVYGNKYFKTNLILANKNKYYFEKSLLSHKNLYKYVFLCIFQATESALLDHMEKCFSSIFGSKFTENTKHYYLVNKNKVVLYLYILPLHSFLRSTILISSFLLNHLHR